MRSWDWAVLILWSSSMDLGWGEAGWLPVSNSVLLVLELSFQRRSEMGSMGWGGMGSMG